MERLGNCQAWYSADENKVELTSYESVVATYDRKKNVLTLHDAWDCSTTTAAQVSRFCQEVLHMEDACAAALRKAMKKGSRLNGATVLYDGAE